MLAGVDDDDVHGLPRLEGDDGVDAERSGVLQQRQVNRVRRDGESVGRVLILRVWRAVGAVGIPVAC